MPDRRGLPAEGATNGQGAGTPVAPASAGLNVFYVVGRLEEGGTAHPIPAIVRAIQLAGHEVRVLACGPVDSVAAARLQAEGVRFELLASGGDYRWQSLQRLFALARAARPGVIWTSLPRATLDGQIVGRALGIPVVSWQEGAFDRRAGHWATPMLQRLSDRWVAGSEEAAESLTEAMRVPVHRVARWPLFVADRDAPRAAAWAGAGPFMIGSIGRLSPEKDYPTLLRAFARLRTIAPELFARCRLAIAGVGPQEAGLRRLADELGIAAACDLTGRPDDPASFLSTLHLYVQPSATEGVGRAAHRAMAAGLPVIATPVGELRRSVRDGKTGRIVPPGDPAALARALHDLAADPAAAHAMGLRARSYVLSRFSQDGYNATAAGILREVRRPAAMQPAGAVVARAG